MGFPKSVAIQALVACGRCCCICHKFCGTNIELHHIQQKADGGPDTFDNCIPLCFDCHAQMGRPDPRHSKGKAYSPEELKAHRNKWYAQKTAECKSAEIVCEADKKLADYIHTLFSQVEYVLTKHDMEGAFLQDEIAEWIRYAELSDDPVNAFIDPELEELRQQMLTKVCDCIGVFRRYLHWDCGTNHNLCAPLIWLYRHNKIEQASTDMVESYLEEVRCLTQVAEEAWKAYIDFWQHARLRIER